MTKNKKARFGKDAANWRGGVSRKWALRTFKEKECWACGATSIYLELHHIDGDKRNNTKENLVTLCKSCHTKIHRNQ